MITDPDEKLKKYWHVLHVRPRSEKKMASRCKSMGLGNYLPLRLETKIYQRRKVTVEKPLFSGYIFVSLTFEEKTELYQETENILKIITPPDQRAFLHELVQIRRALRVDQTLTPCDALQRGRMVRIKYGPFQGIEGKVWGIKGSNKVRLNVDMIGQAVMVEAEIEALEPLD